MLKRLALMAVIATVGFSMLNSQESTTIDFAEVESVSPNLYLCDTAVFGTICETKCIKH